MNEHDIVYTPDTLAKSIVNRYRPSGKVLEPCRGNGAFTKYMPNCDWCELQSHRDFFDYTEHVDWIVSNPPYSLWNEWLVHSFEIADNIVYLIPFAKIMRTWKTIRSIFEYGGIVEIVFVGPGNRAGFRYGFPCGVVYMKRNYCGPIAVYIADDTFVGAHKNKEESENSVQQAVGQNDCYVFEKVL